MTTSERVRAKTDRKPYDDEIDVYGLTHPGAVREVNQDHFLIASLRKQMEVHLTSLPDVARLPVEAQRLAFLAMVADGVGGGTRGGEASRLAVETVSQYVAKSLHCYYTADATDEDAFARALEEAALRVHADVLERAGERAELRGMATTLTVWIGVWPEAYLLQIGDSRCYILRGDELTQISRDQTMAQELLDQGILSRTDAFQTRWAHVLSSAIGGSQSAPVVTRMHQVWGNVGLLCSDGLTKHVSDERIRERLLAMRSAKQVCEALLQDALDDGGSDNITILVGRTIRRAD